MNFTSNGGFVGARARRASKNLLACALLLSACGAPPAPAAPVRDPVAVGKGGGSVPAAAAAPAAASEDGALIPIASDDAVRGGRLASVTIVVFSDFECPFCSRIEPTLARLRQTYGEDKLRVVFKNNPLPFHRNARLAAEIGQGVLTLAGPEAFWRYHDTVFTRQHEISPEALRTWAVAAGVDPRALEDGLEARRFAAKVDRDIALAERLEATGTPASFVNGVLVSGAQPFERFKDAVDDAIVHANELLERGTPRDQLYTRAVEANAGAKGAHDGKRDDRAAAAAEEAAAEAKVVYAIPVGSGPTRGPATAAVTIVMFSDFECPFCKRAEETLARVVAEYGDKVRIVWRDLPLSFHPHAEPAAELARAARAQKGDAGFWQVDDLLFAAQSNLEEADLERVARAAKLDVAKAMADVKSKTYRRAIEADAGVAEDFGASGTPNFFINGRRVTGAQPFDTFKAILDEEVLKAEALLRAGTPRAGLYAALTKGGKGPAEPEKKTIAPAPKGAPFRGAANAKVVIHQVSDFQCPFCQRVETTVDELLKAYPGKIKVVWRDKPLSQIHPDAALAAEAAREAYAQRGNDGFARMHKLLFDNQGALSRADLDGYAATIGLDAARFAKALDEHVHAAAIEADFKATETAGVRGTPAFFVGPYYLSGAQPYAKFRKLVDRVLAESKSGS